MTMARMLASMAFATDCTGVGEFCGNRVLSAGDEVVIPRWRHSRNPWVFVREAKIRASVIRGARMRKHAVQRPFLAKWLWYVPRVSINTRCI